MEELSNEKNEIYPLIHPNNILYIFKVLSRFVLILGNEEYYHSDIKPQNITILGDKIKLIDLGGVSNKLNPKEGTTPIYFNRARN